MKKERGITLIALVITIIVLLVLAGVSIAMVVGNNGILNQASSSVIETSIATEKGQVSLAAMGAKMDNEEATNLEITEENFEKELNLVIGERDVDYTLEKEENYYVVTYIESGRSYYVENITGKVVDEPQIEVSYASDVLIAGNSVIYIDANGEERLCNVLYDASSNLGIQLVTTETVQDVELGNGTGEHKSGESFLKLSIQSYCDGAETLKTVASSYMNKNFSQLARATGTMAKSGEYFASQQSTGDSLRQLGVYLVPQNTNFISTCQDYKALEALGILNINSSYWLAQPYYQLNQDASGAHEFGYLYMVSETGNVEQVRIFECHWNFKYLNGYSRNYGLRVVFDLLDNVYITGGNGTVENPYQLGV